MDRQFNPILEDYIDSVRSKGLMLKDFLDYKVQLSPLKPLTALIDSQQDCHKIFQFAMGIDYKSRHFSKDCIQMQGENPGEIMQIHFDGYLRIAFKFHGEVGSRRNHFALTDYIRELGYEPVTKTT